jgi:hypothetical protein
MSAFPSTVERRPMPTVAIVGNDAVLAAAPATPVQLAHACLQHGFTVAVPASWGDELVAAETVRRLVSRDRGPAVMCVCPFVRSRLLAPGPDLAPFLVSLVAPPVAAARYLRAAYGEHGVHITYIGSCPSADDPAIDVSLTPSAFLAEIADHGIALSEQPLVFDSIVPPDRRRWCSMPGGVPSPEVLWNDADGRTLAEIDRDEVSTDLAQHIITREHVLLDLAPGLGCACSGAIAPLPTRSARVAVTALEPPRALGPVIDSASVVPLDAPVGAPPSVLRPAVAAIVPNADPTPVSGRRDLTAEILDQEIGRPVWNDDAASTAEPASDATRSSGIAPGLVELDAHTSAAGVPSSALAAPAERRPGPAREHPAVAIEEPSSAEAVSSTSEPLATSATRSEDRSLTGGLHDGLAESVVDAAGVVAAESDIETLVESPAESLSEQLPESSADAETEPPMEPESSPETTGVRRRAPVSVPLRHPAASIPRTAASGGRRLPRAYVAKRRTPPAGVTVIGGGPAAPAPLAELPHPPVADDRPGEPMGDHSSPSSSPSSSLSSPPPPESRAHEEFPSASGIVTTDTATPPLSPAYGPPPSARHEASKSSKAVESRPSRAGGAAPAGGYRPIVILLVVALVALTAFVLWKL